MSILVYEQSKRQRTLRRKKSSFIMTIALPSFTILAICDSIAMLETAVSDAVEQRRCVCLPVERWHNLSSPRPTRLEIAITSSLEEGRLGMESQVRMRAIEGDCGAIQPGRYEGGTIVIIQIALLFRRSRGRVSNSNMNRADARYRIKDGANRIAQLIVIPNTPLISCMYLCMYSVPKKIYLKW